MSEKPVITLPLDRVRVGKRLRQVDPDWATQIGLSMRARGQDTPIWVGPADAEGVHTLIAGGHRVEGATLAGLPTIKALVFEGNELQRRLLEIDENLLRRELTELDRAVFLAERRAVYESLHPETAHGKAPKGPKGKVEENFHFVPRPESFAAEAAKKLGVSDRQVRTYLKRAEIDPRARELLAGTRWADHGATLDALVKQPPPMQVKVATALSRGENPARTFADALAEFEARRAPVENVDDLQFRRLLNLWKPSHTGAKAREMFLRHLAQEPASRARLLALLDADEAAEERQARVVAAVGAAGRAA